jgi:DsbC/DsbD-like thiol-disulfide interchange protein
MQFCFHRAELLTAERTSLGAVALALFIMTVEMIFPHAAYSQSLVGPWSEQPKSSVRLIAAASGPEDRPWQIGVELELAAGALTYWRTPGGAGVAPVFDFAGTENVADVEVRYPVPQRIEEEGTEVYGYRDTVTFPLDVTPMDPSRHIRLTLTLSYAVCERICLPARAKTALDLPPRPASSPSDDAQSLAIAGARALVPRLSSARERDAKLSIAPVADATPPTWRVVVRDEAVRDLFVEGAEGWYFETRKAAASGEFLIIEADRPSSMVDEAAALPVTLTLAQSPQSSEFRVLLDRAAPSR